MFALLVAALSNALDTVLASRRHPLSRAWSSGSDAVQTPARTAPMRTSGLRSAGASEDLFALRTGTLSSLDCGKEGASAAEKSGSASRGRRRGMPPAHAVGYDLLM